jgi:RNase P subunit RPR2
MKIKVFGVAPGLGVGVSVDGGTPGAQTVRLPNAGFGYLEVKCLGCNTHQTVALDIVRRPKTTPIHELERYMRCRQCSEMRRYPYKRSHLVALRPKISADDPPSHWWR